MSDALKQALEALKANHQWHQDHDEHDGYPDSDLEAQNVAAIAALSAPQPAEPAPKVAFFDVGVAHRKWDALRAEGHAMRAIIFTGPKGDGWIDPWGKVTWGSEPQPAAPQGGLCDEDARLTAAGKVANRLGIKTVDAYKVIAAYTTPQPAAPQSDPCAPPEIQEAIKRGEFEPGQWTVSAQRAIEKNPSGALRIIAKLRDEVAGLKAAPQPAQAVPQWRAKGSGPWWDGYPDNEDGGGPYETRALYANGIKQPGSEA